MLPREGTNSVEEILEYILSGPVRIKIFTFLTIKPSYAYEIVREMRLHPTTAVQILKEMLDGSIVKCLNPISFGRKYYELTMEALMLKEKISKCGASTMLANGELGNSGWVGPL